MNGIELSQAYFTKVALPLLRREAPHIVERCAAGLVAGGLDVGGGSELYGFDDAMSADHNWGPRFFLFLNEADYGAHAQGLRALFAQKLQATFAGHAIVPTSAQAVHFHITTPQRNMLAALDVDAPPTADVDWYCVPEAKLCEYGAGRVYYDPLDMMPAYKNRYAAYPPNVRNKRLAGAFFMLHTAGNALRCFARGEEAAGRSYLAATIANAHRAALLLSGRFVPHVKWRARACGQWGELPTSWAQGLEGLIAAPMEGLAARVHALLCTLGEMANASGLIEPVPLVAQGGFLLFNCYGFSAAFEAAVTGELAGRARFVALDQMAEGYMPFGTAALRAHWMAGRPGIAHLL